MEDKKEIQKTILNQSKHIEKATEDEFINVLKMIAPGTHFRTALDGILKGGKGALIVLENELLHSIIEGGFRINARFTPQRLVELSKMDGAIILSNDIKKIEHANVLLMPDNTIRSLETGTRHKAAERTAKQIGELAIAISERRHEITLFYKNIRYPLKRTDEILGKVNQYTQIIEKQRELFDNALKRLMSSELFLNPNLKQAILVIQKGKLIQKMADELKQPIVELGNEGPVFKSRLKELLSGVEKETNLVLKDYTLISLKNSKSFLDDFSYDELQDQEKLLKTLSL